MDRNGYLEGALQELDLPDEMDPRAGGRPNKTKVAHQAGRSKRDVALSDARRRQQIPLPQARAAVAATFYPIFYRALRPNLGRIGAVLQDVDNLANHLVNAAINGISMDPTADPKVILAAIGLKRMLDAINKRTNFSDPKAVDEVATNVSKIILSEMPDALKGPAVVAYIAALKLTRAKPQRSPGKPGSGESESQWHALSRTHSTTPAASQARQGLRAATAPAFVAALDRAVDAKLLTEFAAKQSGGVDAAKLRAAYVDGATRRFAREFVHTIGHAPPGTSEQLALGAIIAVAIAQTSQQFPIVPPTAITPMAVMIHKALQPRMAELARLGAIAAATAARTPTRTPARPVGQHELSW